MSLSALFYQYNASMNQKNITRRPMIAVVGEAGAKAGEPAYQQAMELGKELINGGFRICSGGLSGVMTAVFEGAHRAESYREGDTVAIIPTLDHRSANQYADIVIATGLGHLRNGIVAAAEAVVIIGGKAGTLSEIAMAWRYNRLIIALSASGGVAAEYAGKKLDNRDHRRQHAALECIYDASTPQIAVDYIRKNLSECLLPIKDFGSF